MSLLGLNITIARVHSTMIHSEEKSNERETNTYIIVSEKKRQNNIHIARRIKCNRLKMLSSYIFMKIATPNKFKELLKVCRQDATSI